MFLFLFIDLMRNMCTDIDYYPHLLMMKEKDFTLPNEYDRRKSWAPSVSSSSSSSTTTTTTTATNSTSWIERKLFSHFKRFFRRNSPSSQSNSSLSSRRPSSTAEEVITTCSIEQPKSTDAEEGSKDLETLPPPPPSSSISTPICEEKQSNSIDLFYDYDRLLARCLERQEHDRNAMISRCQTPVTIPHVDLIVGHSRSIVNNWKSYTRLFRALNRDVQLFQQYINQYYACQSSINQREQLTFNVRTTKTTFDNVLKTFLNEYVTCFACQKAQTHLIKSIGLWRIECQLCGSQRSVKRLRWKH
jgi:translation initiation factor 2 beta subunit (eIF-2beta)/eIF-5